MSSVALRLRGRVAPSSLRPLVRTTPQLRCLAVQSLAMHVAAVLLFMAVTPWPVSAAVHALLAE